MTCAVGAVTSMVLSGLLAVGPAPSAGAQTVARVSAAGHTLTAAHPVAKTPPGAANGSSQPQVLGHIKAPACGKHLPQYRAALANGHQARITIGCIRVGNTAAPSAVPSARSGVNAAAAGTTPPAVCPAVPTGGIQADRFDICAYFPANMAITVTDVPGGATHVVIVNFLLESWAELSNASRTWVMTNLITPTAIVGLEPADGAVTGKVGGACTDSSCKVVSSTPANGVLSPVEPAGTLMAQYGFDDTATSNTVNLASQLELGFNITGATCVASCSPVKLTLDGGGNNTLPIRCDSAISQSGFQNGCVISQIDPHWVVTDAIYPKMGIIVKHDAMATGNLPGYQGPPWELPGDPGKKTPLQYLGPNNPQSTTNYNAACGGKSPSAADVALGNTSCDEYPFQSTVQGGASASTCFVPPSTQNSQGGNYNNFIVSNRVLADDYFYVDANYSGNAPGCGASGGSTGSPVPDTSLDGMFTDYGNSAACANWSGGDATNSVVLPDGERAWSFSDTFLNSPAQRKGIWYASGIHNSIVMQGASGGITKTITGGNTCQETNTNISFWSRYANTPATDGTNTFDWTGDQMVSGSNLIKFYYGGNSLAGPFSPGIASIPLSSMESPALDSAGNPMITIPVHLFSCTGGPNVVWGTSLLTQGSTIYIYGWLNHRVYLAKTSLADLASPENASSPFTGWSFYDGNGATFGSSCTQATPIPSVPDNDADFSVDVINGGYWLIQDYGGEIDAYPSTTPWGFTASSVNLYTPPEDSNSGYPYYEINYGARLQPGLGASGEAVISYNVNTTSVDTGCESANNHDAGIYRPRFIDVPDSAFNAGNAKAPAARAMQVARAGDTLPGDGIHHSGAPFPAADPAALMASRLEPSVSRASAAAPAATDSIDGSTDWFDKPFGASCPNIPGPSAAPTLTLETANDNGWVDATWPNVGTDVWYWGYICDETENACPASGAAAQGWIQTWPYAGADLWEPVPSGVFDPIDATTVTGNNTNGHKFGILVKSFGAGNGTGGGYSPVASITITR